MKTTEKSFYEELNRIIHSNISNEFNAFVKNNAWVIPLIYFVGTIALIIRNKKYGLPFYPISIIQFAVIVVYISVFLIIYAFIEYNIISLIESIKKIPKEKKKGIIELLSCLFLYIVLLGITSYILYFITGETGKTVLLCFVYYFFLPIAMVTINSKYRISNIIIVLLYIMLILEVPISIGGFKGQNVLYHDIETNTNKEYIYYGNYEGLYQFSDDENIYLIPIDNGYIIYKK
ncbi:MAG: hypothetical protein K1W33_01030 [Clostridia bacterium]